MNISTRSEMNVIACNSANAFKKFLSHIAMMLSLFVLVNESAFAQPTTFSWRGEATNGNWDNSTNWWNGSANSTAGFGILFFNNNNQTTMTNNFSSTFSTFGLRFNDNTARTIGGTAVRLFDNGGSDPFIENNSTGTHVMNFNLEADGDAGDPLNININGTGGFTFGGTVNNQGSTINIVGSRSASGGDVTFSGVMSGNGGLYKENSNILAILSANNTYSGQTTIQGGTLRLSGSGSIPSSNVRLHSGGTLNIANSASVLSVAEFGSGNAGVVSINSGATLTIAGGWGATTLFQNNITGSGGLTKNGTGTLSLYGTQSYSGTTTVNGGTLSSSVAMSTSSLTLGGGNFTTSAANILPDNTPVSISSGTYTLGGSDAIGSLAGAGGNVTLGSHTLTTGGDNTSTEYSGVIGGTGAIVKSGTGSFTLSGANTYSGSTSVTGGSLIISSDVRLGTAPVSATAGHLTLNGGTLNTTAEFTLSSNRGISLGASNGTINTNTSTTLTYGGIIAGSGTLTKSGSGTLILSAGTSTYTGSTTITAGTLSIGADARLGTAPASATAGHLTLNGGTLNTTASFTLATNRGISLGASNGTINTDASTELTYGGVMAGTGTFTKSGTGTLILTSGSNSYSGSTTVSAGILRANNTVSSTAGNGAFGSNTTTLNLAGGTIQSNTATFSRPITITATNSGLDAFGSARTISSNITLATAGSFNLNVGGTTVASAAGQELTLSGSITNTSGTLSLTKIGTSTVILSNTNSYTGNTTISAGTLRLAIADAISNSSNMIMSGGTFRTGPAGSPGFSEQLGTITVTENSDIRFGTGNHTLRFAASNGSESQWTSGKTLTIYNWIGTAGVGASASNPKLFIGTDANGLTQSQLDAIVFDGYGTATILSTGEIVPTISLNITSAQSGDWNLTSTWSGGVIPSTNDNVFIASTHAITVSSTTSCKSVTFTGSSATLVSGTLTINSGQSLTVSGNVRRTGVEGTASTSLISGAGTLNVGGNLEVGGNTDYTPSANVANILRTTITNLNVTGNLNITGRGTSSFNNPRFYLEEGTLTLTGQIVATTASTSGSAACRFWMDQGNQTGKLVLLNADPWATFSNFREPWGNQTSASALYSVILNGTNATVEYAASGNQTIVSAFSAFVGTNTLAFRNLTISGSGTKSVASSGAVTIASTLSVQGSANITGTVTSGTTLEYKNAGTRNTTAVEWPSTSGPANVIIDGGTVTLHAGRNISGNLTLTSGTLSDGGFTLGVAGNIAGTATHTSTLSGGISMTGTNATISGATLQNLTLNGSGFSLSGSPTITGNLALTAGTLTVGAQTLTYSGSSITRTSGNIDASNASATLTFSNGTGFTFPASLFSGNINNLTLSGAGGVTLGGATTVAGTLTLTTGTLTTGANTLTYSGSSITRTNGNIDASNASGAVAFTNTGSSLSLPASLFSGTVSTFTVNGSGGVTLGGSVSIRTLNLSSGTLTVGSGNTVTITSGGSVVRTSGALANGTSAGTFSFAGTGSVSGTVAFNNVTIDGALTPSTTTTINGTLQINAGSSIVTNSPIFGSSSTLQYNHGGNFAARRTQALEWPASNGPANLTIINDSWIQLAGARSLTGNVTITSGALQASGQRTLTMAGTNQTFTVSTSTGGGVFGTDNGTNNDLTLAIANGSTTTFTGDATGSSQFDDEKKFVSVNVNSGGTLILQRGILVKYGTFTVDGSLQLNSGGYVRGDGTMSGGTAADIRLPVYGSTSTLIYNSGGTYNVGFEWTANAASGAGVPRNVTIGNGVNTTLSFASSGQFRRANGNVTISANSGLTLSSASGGDLYVGGNFTNNGTFTPSSRMVEFVGGAAQTITGSFGTPGSTNNFAFLKISNTSGGVSLGVSTPVLVTNTLELNSGILTTGSNLLSLNSGVAGAISGGSSSSFINGSLSRAITPATDTWVFPVGKGSTYLPYGITNPVGSSPVVTVEAFTSNAGGTPGAGLSSLSNAEYWSAVNTGTLTSAIISLAKTSIGSNTGIGFTTTPPTGGTYANLGGSITNTLINSNTVTSSSTVGSLATTTYFVLGTTGYITTQAGDWNSTSTWQSGVVPPAGSTVTINHAVTVNSSVTDAPASVTINASRSLTFGASGALTATNVTNNGSIVMTAGGTLTIAAGGTLANGTSTFTRGTGTVSFAGTGTISGTIGFNNVTIAGGGTNFGTASTVHGTLRINSGGFVNTNAPTYANTSTLLYNVGNTTYGRGTEWSATSGAGYPNNVQISNSTTLNLGANGGTNTARQLAGNLTVDANATLTMNASGEAMTAALTVKGNYINNGTTTLSGSIGGDLVLEGDLTDNATFNANGRAIFFRGSNTQSITSNTNPLDIDVMRVEKSGGEIVLLQNLLVDETGDPIQFAGTSSILNLNGYTATFGKASTASTITMNSSSAIKGSSTSSLTILGTGAAGTIRFDQTTPGTTNVLQNFTVNRTSGSVTLGNSLRVVGTLALTDGTLIVGGNTLTYSGSSITRTSGTIDASNASATLIFSNGTGVTLPASLFTGNIQNLTMSGAGGITLGSATTVAGTLTLTTGDITTTSTNTLTLGASATISGGSATSHIIGPLDRTLTNGSSFTYPVGTATNYRPLILQSVSATGNPVVRVTMDDAGATTGDANTISATLPSARNWRVQTISGTFNSATLNITETGLTDGVSLIAKSNNNQAGTYVSVGASTVSSGTITSPAGQTPGFYAIGTNCVNPTSGGTIAGDQGVCSGGDPAAFTSSSAASGNTGTLEYKWQSSTTSSISGFSDIDGATGETYNPPSGITSTTYYKRLARVTCKSNWTGAAESNVLTVTVTNPPNAGTLSGTQAICVAGTTTFTSNGNSGGAWTTSNTLVASVDGSTGVVTGEAAGTATITYTVTGTGGCSNATATRTVTVTAAPNAGTLSGTQTLCAGGTTDFNTDGNTGGTWTTSNASVATVNGSTGVVTGVAAGTATITYTVTGSGGCSNATATRDVTVNATPSITGTTPASRCGSGSVTLSATSSAGTINWYAESTGGSSLGTGTSYAPSIGSTTTYYVDATATNGCTTASRTAVIATVNPNVTPSVTISASPSGAIVTGTSVTFTATPTNGGTPSYQWKVGSTNVGSGGNQFTTSTLSNGNVVSVVMTSSLTCVTSATATSDGITMNVSSGSKTWNAVSGNWSEGDKWSPTGVPTSADNITINSGMLTMDVNYTVLNGKSFTMNGGSLIINPGRVFAVASGGTADFNNNPVTLRSTAIGTASIGQIANNGAALTGATNVTVERYLQGRRRWRALTAPVTGTTNNSIFRHWQNDGTPSGATGAIMWKPLPNDQATTGLFTGGVSTSILSFQNGGNGWDQLSDTKLTPLFGASNANPNAYMLFFTGPYNITGQYITSGAAASTLRATGALRQGPVTITVQPGWNMIGNPYASSVQLNAGNELGAAYEWDAGMATVGGYRLIQLPLSTKVIQSGQAIFVFGNSAGASITFTEGSKVSSSDASVFRTEESAVKGDVHVKLNKYVSGNTELYDEAIVNYKERAEYRLPKLAQIQENLSIYQNNEDYGMASRVMNNGEDVIQLRMWQMNEAAYQLNIDLSSLKLPAGSTAVLQDAFLNKETSLSITEANKVDFNVNSNTASTGQRFRIVLRRANVPVTNAENPSYQIYPNPVQKGGNMQLEFRNQTAGKYEVVVYSMTGLRVQKAVVGHNGGTSVQQIALDQRLSAGTYLVEVIGENGAKKQLKLTVQ